MERGEFITVFSEKAGGEAAKEVSLKIKSTFPKGINFLFVLFTPHYNPSEILKTVNLTLAPQRTLGIQAPFLIFEEKIAEKGVVACCINKPDLRVDEFFLKNKDIQEIETFLTTSFKKLKGKGFHFFTFLSPQITTLSYLNGVRLVLGKIFNLLGSGYLKKYSSYSSQIVNNTLNEGLVNLAIKGLDIQPLRLAGYLPLGKPFTITRLIRSRNIIMEINGAPAVNIYRRYLEEKFAAFKKNRLFAFYPLGIESNGVLRLINIIDCLEDGSLVYMGEVTERSCGHIMLLDPDSMLKNIKDKLGAIKADRRGLVFIINSLTRKKILQETSEKEIKLVKEVLGDNFRIIGLYSDYSFFSDAERGDIDIETNDFLLTIWQ